MKNIGKLILIWGISIVAFSVSFSIYAATIRSNFQDPVLMLFMFSLSLVFTVFFAFLCSLPAFIFFATLSFAILRTQYNEKTKKLFMLIINYLDILATCTITFIIISLVREKEGLLYPFKNYFFWYPNWVLIFSSTAAIILMPFRNKKIE